MNKTNKELKKLIGYEDDADAGVDIAVLVAKYPKKGDDVQSEFHFVFVFLVTVSDLICR